MEPKNNISGYVGQRSIKLAAELTEQLNQELFLGTDTGVAYRALNHWESAGLIDNKREKKKDWRRFSFVEFVWIRMIDQLRSIGMKIDTIREIKDEILAPTPLIELWTLMWSIGDMEKLIGGNLTDEDQAEFQDFFEKLLADPPEGEEGETVTFLQLLIANAIAKRCPVILIIFPDGGFFWREENAEFVLPPEFRDRISYEAHVSISITGIIKEFLAGDLAFERIETLNILNPNEAYLLRLIHSGDYDSIKINFRGGQMDALEMKKTVETTRRIVDVLAEADYQDISIIQHQGRVTRFENTIKHRFDQ
ncbi:MAG: MerR family transcriptional regulator [Bacteroidota bacterium]